VTTSTTRRQFLRGAGGALMAIPFLSSLISRAFAAEPAPAAGQNQLEAARRLQVSRVTLIDKLNKYRSFRD
jgi:hypothetical protein